MLWSVYKILRVQTFSAVNGKGRFQERLYPLTIARRTLEQSSTFNKSTSVHLTGPLTFPAVPQQQYFVAD